MPIRAESEVELRRTCTAQCHATWDHTDEGRAAEHAALQQFDQRATECLRAP